MKNPLKISLLFLLVFSSFLFIKCSDNEENTDAKESLTEDSIEELDLSFIYDPDFMDKNNIDQIEVELNTDGDKIYTLSFDQEVYTKGAVAPGEDKKCFNEECVISELEECFEKGGTKAVVEKKKVLGKTVAVEVSCE